MINIVERDFLIFEKVASGVTFLDLAKINGISAVRVRQCSHNVMLKVMRHCQNSGIQIPKHNPYNVKEFRAHKDFWIMALRHRQAKI